MAIRKRVFKLIKNILFFLIIYIPTLGFSLESKPWFGDIYQFIWKTQYAYSHFSTANGSLKPLERSYNDNLLCSDLELSYNPQWDVDVDIEFIDTPIQSFSFSSTALQLRYLLMDDVVGDAVSLVLGGGARYVSSRSLKDISIMYHGNMNFEASLSIGKEFNSFQMWDCRLWGYGALGLANRGSLWLKGQFFAEGNILDKHYFTLGSLFLRSYGNKKYLDEDNFNGYGKIRQKSLDVLLRYGLKMSVWGTLYFEYKRRVIAKVCPSNVNTYSIIYKLPFSF